MRITSTCSNKWHLCLGPTFCSVWLWNTSNQIESGEPPGSCVACCCPAVVWIIHRDTVAGETCSHWIIQMSFIFLCWESQNEGGREGGIHLYSFLVSRRGGKEWETWKQNCNTSAGSMRPVRTYIFGNEAELLWILGLRCDFFCETVWLNLHALSHLKHQIKLFWQHKSNRNGLQPVLSSIILWPDPLTPPHSPAFLCAENHRIKMCRTLKLCAHEKTLQCF